MLLDASCPKHTPQQEPGVGPTWMPWCDGGHNATAGATAGGARAAAGRPSTRGAAATSPADDGANATTGRRVRRRTGGDA